jgi:hypothetical protein
MGSMRSKRDRTLHQAQLKPRSEQMLEDSKATFWVLPMFETNSTQEQSNFNPRTYDGIFKLLNSSFNDQEQTIRASVYNDRHPTAKMKFRPEQFSPCRVACLTINDHVVTALTYRVTKPTTCGAAVMVRSCSCRCTALARPGGLRERQRAWDASKHAHLSLSSHDSSYAACYALTSLTRRRAPSHCMCTATNTEHRAALLQIQYLATRPDVRKRGLAQLLLASFLRAAREDGMTVGANLPHHMSCTLCHCNPEA